jgi:hypothetical protein
MPEQDGRPGEADDGPKCVSEERTCLHQKSGPESLAGGAANRFRGDWSWCCGIGKPDNECGEEECHEGGLQRIRVNNSEALYKPSGYEQYVDRP